MGRWGLGDQMDHFPAQMSGGPAAGGHRAPLATDPTCCSPANHRRALDTTTGRANPAAAAGDPTREGARS